jgi:methionyl-tRNA formyltransferase
VRAFDPWPVAWCAIGGERVRVWKSQHVRLPHRQPSGAEWGAESGAEPGTVLSASRDGIDVATGSEVLRLLELQPPGKRRMCAADFLNARRLPGRLGAR